MGWRRRFNTEAVKSVRLQSKRWRDSDGDARNREDILLETLEGKEIRFGSGLPAERRKFLASALKQLFQRSTNR